MTARAWVGFAALGVVWGIPYFFVKIAVRELSPFDVAWGRVALGAVILVSIAGWRRVLEVLVEHKAAVCAFGLTECAIPYTSVALGEQWIPSSVAGILNGAVPLIILLIAGFFGIRERPGPLGLLGIVLGFAGICILAGFQAVSRPLGAAGVGCMVIAMACYAIAPLVIQRHLHAVDPIEGAAACLVVATLALIAPAALTFPQRVPDALVLSSVAILGGVCTAVGTVLMAHLVKSVGAYRTSIATYINPLVAAILGVLVLHERLDVGNAGGLGFILVGLWLATRRPEQDIVRQRQDSLGVS